MNSAAAERDIINPATGEVIATVPESAIVETLIEEAMRLAEQIPAESTDDTSPSGKPVVTTY